MRGWNQVLTAAACAGCLLVGSIAAAQQGDQNQRRDQQDRRQQSGQQGDQPAELPQALQKLDLDDDQQQEIKQALTEQNQKYRETWMQFHQKHAQAIELEAAWLAAVRDTLSEEDQRKLDQQRMQDQELTKFSEGGESSGDARSRNANAERRNNRQQAQNERGQDDREGQRQRDRRRQNDQQQANNPSEKGQGESRGGDQAQREQQQFFVLTLISPERYIQDANQSPEQKQQCDEACRQYQQEAKTVWQDLHRLHHQLVSIEADRLQAIEQHLTEEQLTKLREDRQQPPHQARSTTSSDRRSR